MNSIDNRHLWCALALVFWIVVPQRATCAASLSLNPSSDAFVTTGSSGNLSANNYGGAGALSIAAPGLAQGEFQSLLQFNLAGAKTSFDNQFGAGLWTIQSVTLQLSAAPPNNALFNASAAGSFTVSWMQNDSWLEGSGTPQSPSPTGISYSSLNSFLSAADENLGTFSFAGGTNGSASYTLGLTPSFSADLLAGNSVSMRMLAGDTNVSYLFDSRSFGTAAARPLLTITIVPEPGMVPMCLLGLALAFPLMDSRFRRI